MDRKDFQTAAQDYQDYLAKKPDDSLAHFNLGYAWMAMQKLSDARGEYEKAISLDPKMAPAYLNLGLTLIDTDPPAAVAPLEKAVEMIPNQAGPKFLLGTALEANHKFPEAIEQYSKAAEIFTEAGRAEDALFCWERTAQLAPENISRQLRLA